MDDLERKKVADARALLDAAAETELEECRKLVREMGISHSNEMPPPSKPGSFTVRNVSLQSNLFGVRIEEDKPIYQYDVWIYSELGTKMIDFTKKGNTDHIVSDRKRKCVDIFKTAIRETTFYRNDVFYFYDAQSIMYTTEKLVFRDPTKPNETVLIDGSNVSEELNMFKSITLVVKQCADEGFECQLSDIRKLDCSIGNKDRSAMQFVDVVSSMNAQHNPDRFTVFAHGKIFPNRPDLENIQVVKLKEGKVLIPGLNKSIKLIEGYRGRGRATPAIAIDSLKAAFHQKEKLIDKAASVFNIKSPSVQEVESFALQVRGLAVMTTHTPRQRKLEIHGISRDNASKRMEFAVGTSGARDMTVAEYFKMKYNLDLKYPLAPLVMSREKGQINLYPMEVLDVVPMQRVTIPQTTGAQSQVTTKECAVGPAARQHAIMDQCRIHDFLNPDQPNLKAAGFSIVPTPLQLEGRQLNAPTLLYKTNELPISALSGNWKPPHSFQFAVPAACGKWGLFAVLGPRDRFTQADLERFGQSFVKRCRDRGMNMPEPTECGFLGPPPEGKTADFPARMKIRDASYHGCTFMFFITNDMIMTHKHIKLEERYSRMITQNLKLKTAQNYLEKSQQQTMDNIVYKTNLKLGGLNWGISIKHVIPNADPFPSTRLIMGIGIAHHPGPVIESSTGKVTPSVVGYAANMATYPTEFIGDFIYQEGKKEEMLLCTRELIQCVIDRFTGKVAPDGSRCKEATKPPPKELIVYRQGVSEGSYAMVMKEEIPLLKAILAKAGSPETKVTFIVVQKEHNIRIMPTEIRASDKPMQQNIGSGIVVDDKITHPTYREFFLNSHLTLQGTARTPRYTVLHDDSNISMNQLQMVTHSLAFNFQIVNSPISIPAPLYIANRYAERGMNVHTARLSDEMATSEQKARTSLVCLNEDLPYTRTPLGKLRINA